MARTVTVDELAKHTSEGDMWVAIDGDVYDVSKFVNMHPGGSLILENYSGQDATAEFYELHRQSVLDKYKRLKVAKLDSSACKPPAEEPETGDIGDLPAFRGQNTTYYNESHKKFMYAVREIVSTELEPEAEQLDIEGESPDEEKRNMLGMTGLLAIRMGPGPWLQKAVEAGVSIPGGIRPDEFDYFHEMIAHQEVGRLGRAGYIDSCGAGWLISVPAVYNFGTPFMKEEIGPQLLRGEKWSSLAISEPFAGSDVAALRTTATKTPDGKFYIVNGLKKWITEGMYSDYFVTAVRTGAKGSGGISMLLIERGEGVETKLIKTTYSTCPGTSLVIYKDVKVPVENLMGEEGQGFKQVMYNFNHERWLIVCSLLGQARAALSDTYKWTRQRSIFGKLLIDQPVIRNKLANATACLEASQALLETTTYDMTKTKGGAVGQKLAGPIALLKYATTRQCWNIADDCVQILGGRGITRTGMGAKVESFKNFCKYAAVYGGSEEIMAELTVKQSMKSFPAQARL